MAIQLGSAYGKVEIDGSGVTRGVDTSIQSLNKLGSVATALGNSLSNIGNSMTIGLTLPILATGAASIKAASDYEETRTKPWWSSRKWQIAWWRIPTALPRPWA